MSAAEDMTVVIVVRPEDEEAFIDVFHREIDHSAFNKLTKKQQDYGRRLMTLGKSVKLVIQPRDCLKSLSEAVLCARPLIG